jgi:catalase
MPSQHRIARRRVEEEAVTTRFSVVTGDDESAGSERDPRPSGARTEDT